MEDVTNSEGQSTIDEDSSILDQSELDDEINAQMAIVNEPTDEEQILELCALLGITSAQSVFTQFVEEVEREGADSALDVASLFKTAGTQIVGNQKIVIPQIDVEFAPAGRREWREHTIPSFVSTRARVFEEGSDLLLEVESNRHIIGSVRNATGHEVVIDSTDILTFADKLSEDVKLKATGMGYSIWVHFAVVVMLARSCPNSCIEPVEGGDVILNVALEAGWATVDRSVKSGTRLPNPNGIRVEVTGVNWHTRSTGCDWVIGKYALMGRMLSSKRDREVLEFALAEDQYDPRPIALMTPVEQRGRYFDVAIEMLSIVRQTTLLQRKTLALMAQRYFWDLDRSDDGKMPVEDCTSLIWKIINAGAKKHGKLPAPCRVVSVPQPDPITALKMARLEPPPQWQFAFGPSTYHIVETNQMNAYINKALARHQPPTSSSGIELGFANSIIPCSAISSCVTIESTLLCRVVGTSGSKYDDSVSIGVVWHRTRENVYKVSYYTWCEPPDVAGKWAKVVTDELVYYRSPTFTVSNTDLEYAQCLYARHETWVRMFVETAERERCYELVEAESKMLLCLHNSSWRTSVWMKNVRFTTSLFLSGARNLDPVLTKGWVESKELRSSEWCFMALCLKVMPNWSLPQDRTPILGFPILWASMEKDLDLMTQWHIRGGNHSTDCMAGIVEAYADEESTIRQSLQYCERQCEFGRKMLEVGVTYREFSDLMDSAPDYPITNFIWSIAESQVSSGEFAKAFAAQSRSGFSVSSLLSNRGAIVVKGNTMSRCRAYKSIESYSRRIGHNTSMSMLHYSLTHPELPTYGITPKDQKNGDRDISTQTANTRVRQAAAECFCGTTGMASETDLLQDPAKHDKAGRLLLASLRYKDGSQVTTSEDRSKFCHNFRTQLMAVSIYCIGICSEINYLSTASAIMSQFGFKEVVVPPGFNQSRLSLQSLVPGIIKFSNVQHRVFETPSIRSERSFQQGMFANAGGLVNDLSVVFWKETVRNHPQVRNAEAMTTSDDSCRTVMMRIQTDKSEIDSKLIIPALKLMKLGSQLNNQRKFISSNLGAEFNRVAYVEDGPIPQSPILAGLAIQPMNGDSIIHDLVQCQNNARTVMLWGGTPYAMSSAYIAAVAYACNRWRISDERYNLLCHIKLILTRADEVLSPWRPRTNVVKELVSMCKPKGGRVASARTDLGWLLHRYGMRREYGESVSNFEGSYDARISMNNLYRAMEEGGRLDLKWQRRPALKRIIEKRDRFFEDLKVAIDSHQSIELLNEGRENDLIIIARHARRTDFEPRTVQIKHKELSVDPSRIVCARVLRAAHQVSPAPEELAVANIGDEETFFSELTKIKMHAVKSPVLHATTGMSQGHIHENVLYRKPMIFDIHPLVAEVAERRERRALRVGLVEFRNVTVCFWNDTSIRLAQGCILAFATAHTPSAGRVAFYTTKRQEIAISHITTSGTNSVDFCNTRDGRVAFMNNYVHGIVSIDNEPLSLPGVLASPVALANIDGYIHSSARRAVAAKRRYLRNHNGSLPDCIVDILPRTGVRPRSRQLIDCGRHYTIIGDYTSDIELKFKPDGGEYLIDCKTPGHHRVELMVMHDTGLDNPIDDQLEMID